MDEAEKARCQDEIRKAAGHDQAAVIGSFVERDRDDPGIFPESIRQTPLPIASQHQITKLWLRFEHQSQRADALRAVSGAGERHHQSRASYGQSLSPMG